MSPSSDGPRTAWTAKLAGDGHEPSYVYALHARLAQILADAVHDGIMPRFAVLEVDLARAGQAVAICGDARSAVDGLADGFRHHDLRHYFASLLIASGADVKTVQGRLRHASPKTTLDTHGHMWPDRDESTRATVEAALVAREESLRNAGALP